MTTTHITPASSSNAATGASPAARVRGLGRSRRQARLVRRRRRLGHPLVRTRFPRRRARRRAASASSAATIRFPPETTFGNETVFNEIVPNERIIFTYSMDRDGVRFSVSLASVELSDAERRHAAPLHRARHVLRRRRRHGDARSRLAGPAGETGQASGGGRLKSWSACRPRDLRRLDGDASPASG